jgi:hypothetical protein
VGPKFNGTHHLLAYADDVNLLDNSIGTIMGKKKKKKTLIDSSKEVGVEIHEEKTKCMLLSPHQNSDQNRNIKVANRSSENVSQFKYFGMTVRNQNLILE